GRARGGPPAGRRAALAAWAGFTLPSAVLLTAFAFGLDLIGGPAGDGAVHGLKLVAVAIVAQAVWGMARRLAPDRPRAGIATAALILVTLVGGSPGQLGAIAGGAAAGLWWCRGDPTPAGGSLRVPLSRRTGLVALSAFLALLLLGPALARATGAQAPALFDAFYRAGALVFGGGHVVLPLLQAEVVAPGWVDDTVFLAGYGAAQAAPGPLFTFAAYLGAVMKPAPNGVAGAALALFAVFLPGLLLVLGTLPFWDRLRTRPRAQAAMRGANAAVVGVLGAALYDPLWTSAVRDPDDFAMAVAGFVLLTAWRAPPWVVVVLGAGIGAVRGLA
ncbi:MAG: chromate efflux transporter, partial [Rhodospirillaceae bacterium]|nr:chromate efflux transporter [Rhodospirillaceae bacterium]